ncbi:MAG: YfiR family protein, partial [Rhodoferax sp.]
DTLRGVPALLIAETPGALKQGAMLNMNLVQGRVTFEANLVAARSARLALSSKLLRLATEVVQ